MADVVGISGLQSIEGYVCDLCGEACDVSTADLNALDCTYAACPTEASVYHQECLEKYLRSIRCEKNRKTGFKCPRGCGRATQYPEPCPGKIDKSHPVQMRGETAKKRKKAKIAEPVAPVVKLNPKDKKAEKAKKEEEAKKKKAAEKAAAAAKPTKPTAPPAAPVTKASAKAAAAAAKVASQKQLAAAAAAMKRELGLQSAPAPARAAPAPAPSREFKTLEEYEAARQASSSSLAGASSSADGPTPVVNAWSMRSLSGRMGSASSLGSVLSQPAGGGAAGISSAAGSGPPSRQESLPSPDAPVAPSPLAAARRTTPEPRLPQPVAPDTRLQGAWAQKERPLAAVAAPGGASAAAPPPPLPPLSSAAFPPPMPSAPSPASSAPSTSRTSTAAAATAVPAADDDMGSDDDGEADGSVSGSAGTAEPLSKAAKKSLKRAEKKAARKAAREEKKAAAAAAVAAIGNAAATAEAAAAAAAAVLAAVQQQEQQQQQVQQQPGSPQRTREFEPAQLASPSPLSSPGSAAAARTAAGVPGDANDADADADTLFDACMEAVAMHKALRCAAQLRQLGFAERACLSAAVQHGAELEPALSWLLDEWLAGGGGAFNEAAGTPLVDVAEEAARVSELANWLGCGLAAAAQAVLDCCGDLEAAASMLFERHEGGGEQATQANGYGYGAASAATLASARSAAPHDSAAALVDALACGSVPAVAAPELFSDPSASWLLQQQQQQREFELFAAAAGLEPTTSGGSGWSAGAGSAAWPPQQRQASGAAQYGADSWYAAAGTTPAANGISLWASTNGTQGGHGHDASGGARRAPDVPEAALLAAAAVASEEGDESGAGAALPGELDLDALMATLMCT